MKLIDQLPKKVVSIFGFDLLKQIKPRFRGEVAEITCPNHRDKQIKHRRKDRLFYWEEEFYYETIRLFHRMKINLRTDKWWCAKCRQGGKLADLKSATKSA